MGVDRSTSLANTVAFERLSRSTLPYDHYAVEVVLLTELLGTVAKEHRLRSEYIAAKAPLPELRSEEEETGPGIEALEKKGATGFHSDSQGLFVYDYFVKGFLKEAADNLKGVKTEGPLGIKNARSKVDNFVFIGPRRIYLLGPDGVPIREPHGHLERPLRAMTMQGPRVSLVGSDFVREGTRLQFEIIVMPSEFRRQHIEMLLEYGLLKGFGQWRNGGYGRFAVERFEVIREM